MKPVISVPFAGEQVPPRQAILSTHPTHHKHSQKLKAANGQNCDLVRVWVLQPLQRSWSFVTSFSPQKPGFLRLYIRFNKGLGFKSIWGCPR